MAKKTIKYEPKPSGSVTLDKSDKPHYKTGGNSSKDKGKK